MATASILQHQATKPAIYTRIRTLARPAASHLLTRAPATVATRPRRNTKQQQQQQRRHPTALFATPSSSRLYTKATSATADRTRLRAEDSSSSSSSSQLATQRRMASDEDYMSFLNKANQDADDAHAAAAANTQSSKTMLKAMDAGEEAPKVIREVCSKAVYVSDADEPFEEVSLRWSGEGGLPDEEEFAKLIHHWDAKNADISIMDPVDWDAQGQYKEVIEAVREASRGNDVRVYRVVRDKTRVEYFVVTREEGRIVGAKALAVES